MKWWIKEKELKVEPLFTETNGLFIKWVEVFAVLLNNHKRSTKNMWKLVKSTKTDLDLDEISDKQYASKIIKHLELQINTSLANEETILKMTDEEWLESLKLYQLILYKENYWHRELKIFYKNLLEKGSPRMIVQTIFQLMKQPENIVWHHSIALARLAQAAFSETAKKLVSILNSKFKFKMETL